MNIPQSRCHPEERRGAVAGVLSRVTTKGDLYLRKERLGWTEGKEEEGDNCTIAGVWVTTGRLHRHRKCRGGKL